MSMDNNQNSERLNNIAIIGMSGRFPGANNVEQFWQNLRDGVESITSFSEEELLKRGVDLEELKHPSYVPSSPVLEGLENFDSEFFGLSRREAEIMDPQQRLFLECAWEALEHSGYNPELYAGQIGVFGGSGLNRYLLFNVAPNHELIQSVGEYPFVLGNDKDFMTMRVSYKLNLKGPSVTIQTACSTSMVAIHTACQNLLNGESDMALAGGVTIAVPHGVGYIPKVGLTSEDGHCKSFSADASGTIFGSGVGIVLLKRLEDALSDGDTVYAVIKGSAINNDGSNKVSFTAPSIDGQIGAISEALAIADVEPDTVSYVETHGTATPMGDLIEITALSKAFRERTDENGFCAIGSGKTNIGHLDTASGVTAVIKTAMSLHHKLLPASLHCETPNPKIDFPSTPFFVNDKLREWQPKPGVLRRAGVSSFGFGGTNAFVVLEEAPDVEASGESREAQLLVLAAKTETALEQMTKNLHDHLAAHPEQPLSDVAYTLQVGRKAFNHRRAVVVRDREDARHVLQSYDPVRMSTGEADTSSGDRPVVFMFPGTGSQYVQMLRDVYDAEPTFRETVDRCCELLEPVLELDLRDAMYPMEGEQGPYDLNETRLLQPALFVVEYALSQLLQEWGIKPEAMIGHSLGEYVVACLAGVFTLEDALVLVSKRAQMVQSLPEGAMLAVYMPEQEVLPLLGTELSVATVNSQGQCVVSGPPVEIKHLEQELTTRGITCVRVKTSSAFHSKMVESIQQEFEQLVRSFQPQIPQIPFISNVTGTWITVNDATDPAYWARHLRQTVRFADGLSELCKNERRIFLEVGPGKTLCNYVEMKKSEGTDVVALQAVRRAKEDVSDVEFLLGALGRLWVQGVRVDWLSFSHDERRQRVAVPTYPFEKQRHWIDPLPVEAMHRVHASSTLASAAHELAPEVTRWMLEMIWQEKGISAAAAGVSDGTWLLFADRGRDGMSALSDALTTRLTAAGHSVIRVYAGESFRRLADDVYELHPTSQADMQALFQAVEGKRNVVHLWSLDGAVDESDIFGSLQTVQDLGVGSVLQLMHGLAALGEQLPVANLWLVTRGAHSLGKPFEGQQSVAPEQAMLWGLGQTIAAEYPDWWGGLVDLDSLNTSEEAAEHLCAELLAEADEDRLLYRNGKRYVARVVHKVVEDSVPFHVQSDGSYLITGGLGNLGLELANRLVDLGATRLILLGRSQAPARSEWESLSDDSKWGPVLRRVRQLESRGAQVMIPSVDVTDEEQLRAFVERYQREWPAIRGVIHAAGVVLEDNVVNTHLDALYDVLQPKVVGGYLLHKTFREQSLDFFVMFSSISSLLNMMRISAYTAANAFLDGLVRARLAMGLPGLTLNWGPWAEIGMAANEVFERVSSSSGMGLLPPALALDAFAHLLGESGTIAVADLQVSRFVSNFPTRSNQRLLEELIRTGDPVVRKTNELKKHGEQGRKLALMGVEDRKAHLEAYLAEQAGVMLSISVAELNVEHGLDDLGLDSLMAIGLKNRIESDLGVIIPVKSMLQASVSSLTQQVLEIVNAGDVAGDEAVISEPEQPAVGKRPADSPARSTFAQDRMWFAEQLAPGGSAYNLPVAVRLTGELNVKELENSFQEIMRRHETLRTTFEIVDGQLIQRIALEEKLPLPMLDLRNLPVEMREERAMQLAFEVASEPFDLNKGPLIRLHMFRLADDDYLLLMSVHHIISDGWSTGVLIRELMTIYEALISGQPSPLEDLPLQYADYAHWQREWLRDDVLADQLNYWKKQLGGLPAPLQLPTDRPRPAVQTYKGSTYLFKLPRALEEKLLSLSKQEGSTMYMTLLAAFKTLLYRYTGQEDLLVGTPVAGRKRSEFESLIGMFVNTLVLRTQVDGEWNFRQLLAKVRDVATDAFEYEDLPFEKLVEELKPERNMSYSPLFQVMFVMLNTPMQATELPGLTVQTLDVDSGASKFDITLLMRSEEEGYIGLIEYNTDLFDRETIERLAGHYLNLLVAVAENPLQTLSELPLLTAEEAEQLAVWNATKREYTQEICLHQLFEAQADKTPDSVAVVFEDQSLTYQALNERANQLAHYLQKQHVGPEVLVGICMERSLEMVVSLYGILKAGGAYVPIDPSYPSDRLAYMLEDSQIQVLLTQEKWVETLPNVSVPIICLDRAEELLAGERTENLPCAATAEHAAYMIYTSGSTGKPKGVLNTHKGIVNRLLWMKDQYELTCEDRVLQKTPFSFDVSVWEFFWPLLTGARLVVARPEGHRDSRYLVEMIQRYGITALHFVPSMLQMFLEESGVDQCRSIRHVMTSGEALSYELQKRFFACLDAELHNLYGPTEAAVEVTYWECERDSNLSFVPIGRPVANTKIYLLDQHLQPVPIGVAGELHIGGVQVARGYHNRPELTAEKFITSPFAVGERLYKTGDLARFLPNGNIQYLGRLDHQVKIRGQRVEMGEIEEVVLQQTDIRDAVVVVREDVPGDQRLVAYLVVHEAEAFDVNELRNFLKKRLPDYMVPSYYMTLDKLPLTTNGKIDRRALPAPDRVARAVSHEYVAPSTATEQALAVVWAELLAVEKVGMHDSFFDLGGHSLLATRLISQVRKLFAIDFPIRQLFETPTIAELARMIDQALQEESGRQAPPMLPVARDQDLPLSFAQERLWFLEQLEPGTSMYNIPVALKVVGSLRVDALERSLFEVVRRHESLRTIFPAFEGTPVQAVQSDITISLLKVDVIEVPENERETKVRRLLQEESQRPFDVTVGPLLRALLVSTSPEEHVLLLNIHHILADGWSMQILVQELSTLYEAFADDKPSPLTELPLQYPDFSYWQRDWLQGDVLEKQLDYWKQQLSGSLPVLQLPTDHQRSASKRGAQQTFVLPAHLLGSLRTLSQQAGATLYMTMFAAFNTLLHRYSGQEDLVVGSTIANRNHAEIEPLIGFFVNTLVMRNDLSGDPSFSELLKRVKQVALEAYEHQDVPFEKLVQALQPDRNLHQTPLFQVMFNLQNDPAQSLEMGGLKFEMLPVDVQTAKFDLTLNLFERETEVEGVLEYNADLFDNGTIQRMIEHFYMLLENIVLNPAQSITKLPMLGAAERQQLLNFNRSERAFASDICLHQLFEAQVAKMPHAVAAVYEEKCLTYEELNRRANQLAHHLQAFGVAPDVPVGVCVERSLELVVALLGVLKAGGAFVPIDTEAPTERMRQVIADANAPVCLSLERFREKVPGDETKWVFLDTDVAAIAEYPVDAPVTTVTPDHLVSIYYTSGSTGKPKGVANVHRGWVNRMCWMQNYHQLQEHEAVLQKTTLTFDDAAVEFFWPLMVGARIVLIEPGLHRDPRAILDAAIQHQVAVMQFVPSMLDLVLDTMTADDREKLQCLHVTVSSGEALRPSLVKRFLEKMHGNLFNSWGATEVSIDSTVHRCTVEDIEAGEVVSIGKPFDNNKVYVLDKYLQPVPIGVVGDLYLAGVGLARCYLNNPERTAQAFVADPFVQGERMYATGDRGYYRSDGSLQFLGRIDNQVKIRGMRVELGEIEQQLAQYPGVQEVVVIVDVREGDKRLIAYVKSFAHEAGDVVKLRQYLLERLPAYMVPAAFVVLEGFPLTPNGKIDRKALPAPDLTDFANEIAYVAPRNPIEQTLAEIMSHLLHLSQVGIHDNFFDLGGHSLLITQVISRIQKEFQVRLPISALFEVPTIAELAVAVEQHQANQSVNQEAEHKPKLGKRSRDAYIRS